MKPTKWTQKFFTCTPLVDESGNPVKQNQQVDTEMYWKRPTTSATILHKQIKKFK